jgi:hypothetical protein
VVVVPTLLQEEDGRRSIVSYDGQEEGASLVFDPSYAGKIGIPQFVGRSKVGSLVWSNRSIFIARGCRVAEPVELPWLDADRSFFVAVNRWPVDDVRIALDYRTDALDPRVVASDWGTGQACIWREVAPAFSGFVRLLGLGRQSPRIDSGAPGDS